MHSYGKKSKGKSKLKGKPKNQLPSTFRHRRKK